jgi:hypothetical protein
MNVQLSAIALLSAAFSSAAALAPASSQPPDRHRSVAGWQIEDVADGEDYDPMRRAIRLRREGPDWQIDYAFVEGAVPVEPSRNAHVTIGSCNEQYGNSEREGATVARARAARTRLLALIAAARQGCQRSTDVAADALAGFEEAFAAADAWDRERNAALAPLRAAAEAAEESAGASEEPRAADAADAAMETNMSSEANGAAPQ